ncbi:UrcA family protein [Sphingomonas sp. R86520]|uniref:UrcA family protein n=1 Tax=Sphingomonas sp. R86520 TaxID=3093859 RepID=UPI0036D27E11
MNTSQRIACSLLSLVGAASLVAFASPASASTAGIDAPRQTTVKYHDLDLTNPAGRAVFDRRVAGAANLVCAQDDRLRSAFEQSCRRHVVEEADRTAGLASQTVRG